MTHYRPLVAVQIFRVLHNPGNADLQEFLLYKCLERNGGIGGNRWLRPRQH
jgi:hypothetical protein